MRWVAVIAAVALLSISCGGDDPSSFSGESSTTASEGIAGSEAFARGWRFVTEPSVSSGSHWSTRLAAVDGVGVVVVHADMGDGWRFDPSDPAGFMSFVSDDGVNWRGGEAWEPGRLGDVVTWAGGFVAAGISEQDGIGAMWKSMDGVRWERVPQAEMPTDLRPCDPEDPALTCFIGIRANPSSLVINGYDPDFEIPEREWLGRADLPGCVRWLSDDDGSGWQRLETPEGCMRVSPVGDGWASVDSSGRVMVTADGSEWQERGALPGLPSLWEFAEGAVVAAKGGEWLAVSLDDARTWEIAEVPTAAQTEGAAVLDDGFVVVAASSQGQFLFHRSRNSIEWTATELVDVPVFSFDLEAHNGRLYGASLNGIWEWDEERVD